MTGGELCKRIGAQTRDLRYILEQGYVPEGVEEAPDRGNHRDLNPRQALWLAVVLKLKASGLSTPHAVKLANQMKGWIDLSANDLSLGPYHNPFAPIVSGKATTYIDVGDSLHLRLYYDPHEGVPPVTQPWTQGQNINNFQPDPFTIIRVNISRLLELLFHTPTPE